MDKYIKNIDQVIENERILLQKEMRDFRGTIDDIIKDERILLQKEMRDFRGTIDDIIKDERTNIRKYILGSVDLKIELNNEDLGLIKEVDNL